jgi:hypothetical protein
MLKNPVEKKVNEWAKKDNAFREINLRIIHLAKWLYGDYLPCQPPEPQFFVRLKKWLENTANDEDQKLLFQLVPEIFFIGEKEFQSLYRTAYNVEISRWIIDQVGLNFSSPSAESDLKKAIAETWFCAATDSFKINDFFKINNVPSKYNIRPDWHALTELDQGIGIVNYVKKHSIKRIVMLEDFVGSGSQVKSRIEYLCQTLPSVSVLVISLITCPDGVISFSGLIPQYSNLSIRHILQLAGPIFVAKAAHAKEPEFHAKIREMVTRLYPITTNGNTNPGNKPYYPLGYNKTGSLVVLYSNTPDNTLPIIHWQSDTWMPLFKRITRI